MCARKAVREELSRARILDTARNLFAEAGYLAVSMRAIAKELDYTPGALYYHFKEKAELFSALIAEDFARLDAELDRVVSSCPDDGLLLLENIFSSFVRFGMENKRSFELMFSIRDADLEKYASPAKMRSYGKFADAVVQGIEGLSSKQQNPVVLVWSLFLALHGFVAFYIHTDQSYEGIKTLADTHVQLLLHGLK